MVWSTGTGELSGAGDRSPELRTAADCVELWRWSGPPKVTQKFRRMSDDKAKLKKETRGSGMRCAHRICRITAADVEVFKLQNRRPGGVVWGV